ncbi:MAG: PaaI family thioesterase [Myxococcales bacterium]|nr:PaaI family thioesterase [Myxococcales bacterium]MBK7191059.1 PaaI family thioesterase [Myxococcales bacterium]
MTAPEDEAAAARRRDRRLAMARAFADNVPHNHALGIVIEAMGDATARFRLPYAAKLVGNPETGVLHGGAITALLDACAGAAVFAALPQLQPIATLDLRIDYLRPAEPGRDVWAEATCHHTSKNVAFVRALAFHADGEAPIATAAGTFMIATKLGTVAPRGGGA